MTKNFLFITVLIFSIYYQTIAQSSFGAPFTNNMVLQRNSSVKIWGTDAPNTQVSINYNWVANGSVSTTSDSNGKWSVFVNTPDGADTPYTVTLQGSQTITLSNVLIGEVWLCSGQSNMVYLLRNADGFADLQATWNDPYIRLLNVPNGTTLEEQESFSEPGSWLEADLDVLDVKNFSAVGFFFGKKLREELGVPIGLIGAAFGSSTLEAWIDEPTLTSLNVTIPNDLTTESKPQKTAGACYNAMIHPLVGYGIKGAIWYQGEANRGQHVAYEERFPAMIKSWRNLFGYGNFSFNYVQLVPFEKEQETYPDFWNMMRNVQLNTVNTGMVVTMDHPWCTEGIHPPEKEYVGNRLAYWALNKDYGQTTLVPVPSGPIAKTVEVVGSTLKVYFDYTGSGLFDGGSNGLTGFEVAGVDGLFYDAVAQINADNTLTLSSTSVSAPITARYGYDFVVCANGEATLFNNEGLPASAFLISENNQATTANVRFKFDETSGNPQNSGSDTGVSASFNGTGTFTLGVNDVDRGNVIYINNNSNSDIRVSGINGGTGGDARTYSFWMKQGTLAFSNLLSTGATNGSGQFKVQLTGSDQIRITDGDNSITTTQQLTGNAWQHIAITVPQDGNIDEIKIYINGGASLLDVNINIDPTINTSVGPFKIAPKFINGYMSDFKYFDYALTDTQIQSLYTESLTGASFNKSTSSKLIVEDNELNKVQVYPNPVDTKLNISGFNKDLPLEIYNTLGVLVKQSSYKATIDVSALSEGIYILKQKELTVKFVKK